MQAFLIQTLGAWILRLREGRSTEIYELKGSVDTEEGNQLAKKTTKNIDTEVLEVLHVLVIRKICTYLFLHLFRWIAFQAKQFAFKWQNGREWKKEIY